MMKLYASLILAITCVLAVSPQTIVVDNAAFRSTYDLGLLCPRQVEWTLHARDIGDGTREPSWRFVNDIPSPFAIARHSDYSHSGYDRGHLCPAGDRSIYSIWMHTTFTMSNIAPQAPTLNRGAWKCSESDCRRAAILHDSISILVLPVFLNRDTTFIGRHRLAVPHAFIKAAWLPGNDSLVHLSMFWNK